MPNKRNGVYKGRPKRGFYLGEDYGSEVEVPGGMMASSVSEENFNFLLDIFPSVDTEIIQAVLLEFNGSLNECIEKLSEISGQQPNHTMEEKSNDLAIIACSLLAEESQPMGVTSLDIPDATEGLGSAALSNTIVQDQQNLESSVRDFSSPAHVEESSGDALKHLNPSVLLRNGIVKDAAVSVNNSTSWLKKQDYGELKNCKPYNIYDNENNKVSKPKPDFLNSSTGSNNFIEEAEDSKLRKELVNDLSWFPNVTKSATDSSEVLSIGVNTSADNGERSVLYENNHHQEINSSMTGTRMQGNIDNRLYETDRRRLHEVNGTSGFAMAGNLNSSDNSLLNSWANVLSEWDRFYSRIESDGFSTYCDSIKLTDAGRIEPNKNSATPAVAENTSQLHRGSVDSEYEINSRLLKMNKSQRNKDLKQKNSSAKAAAYVGSNYTFQSSDAVPTSLGATDATGAASSDLATSFPSSSQRISFPFGSTNPSDLPSCNSATQFPSSAKSIASSYSTVSREDHENSRKETSSKLKLSPGALEFIPRSVSTRLARPVAQSKTAQVASSSRNQKLNEGEDVQSFSGQSPRKTKNAQKGKHKKLHEDTGNQNNFQMPVGFGNRFSSLGDTRQDSGVKSEKNVDPMDPLGWSDIFSESTSSLFDPKPQRTRKARKLSLEKSIQQAAPDPSFSPWQIPSESQQNAPRSSPPMMKPQESSEESFSASFDAVGARSTSSPMHKKSQNGMSSAISSTPRVSNSPIAARLPPSLTSTAGPATAVVNSFVDNANISSSSPTPKKMLSESDVRPHGSAAVPAQSQLLKNKLQLRGVRTPVGVIRHYVHEKQPVMIILRGLPGSGKSYLAKQLLEESQRIGAQGEILSTDNFFMGFGQYSYNRNDLSEAHEWNKKRALQSVKERRSPVIIDNTNTTMWELLPYAVLALQHGYDIQMFEPDTPWRLKVAELARKNVHGVRKENIKKMKERWEHFTLDDVIKQASYSIASRKMPTSGPVNRSSVAPSSAGQRHPTANTQMTTLEQVNVTEVSHQNSSSCIPDSTLQELGLSDWFEAQKPRPSQKMKQKVNLAWSPWKVPNCENAQEAQNQSAKKTVVDVPSMSSSQRAESPDNHSLPESAGLPEIHSSHVLASSTLVATERQLSDESWNSGSETPTVDKDIFGNTSADHVNMLQNTEKEAGTVSTGFPGEITQNEEDTPCSVLNCSLSTSGSFHTVRSNSNVSTYDTVDDDEENVGLSADIVSDEYSADTLPVYDVQMLLKERDVDELHAAVIDAEALPLNLEKMSLGRDEASSMNYMQLGCEKSAHCYENRDLKITSSVDEPLKNNAKAHSVIVRGTLAGSSMEESFVPADLGFSNVAALSSVGIDAKKNCLDSLTHNMRNSSCLTDIITPPSLVDYSDSDDDSGQECSGDDTVCKELSQLCIEDPVGGQMDMGCSKAGNGGQTGDAPDGFKCGQARNSSSARIQHSTERDIGLAQDADIRTVQGADICVHGSFEDREFSLDGLVTERGKCLDGLFQHRGKTVSLLTDDKEMSLCESIDKAEISSVALVQDQEISVGMSIEDKEINVHRSTPEISVDRSIEDRESSVHGSTPDKEIIFDTLTQSSEDSLQSSREQSPPIDGSATTVDLQPKKKKKRIRKGRNPGPFIEESVKVISKSQNWSSFVKQSSDCSNSSGESVVLEPERPCVDTMSTATETDPYEFSLVYKLNSPAFNSFQPVDWTLRGVNVISSSSQAVIPKKLEATTDQACPAVFRKTNTASDQSTVTDETLEKEELDLETLQSCFPEYSRKQLEATMAICHNDLEWVTSHLLDSPALYDMEDDEEDMPKDEVLKPEEVPVTSRSSGSIKSLADMCTMLVKKTNKVDPDDLEMQVIQVGEGRLQKIEMFNRHRYHNLSHDDRGGNEYWQDDLLLDDLILTRAKSNFKKRSKLEQQQSISPKTPTFDHEQSTQTSSVFPVPDSENPPVSSLQDQESRAVVFPSVFEGTESSSVPLTGLTASEEVNTPTGQSAIIESQPVLPLEFVKHLERLYGPLAIHVDEEGLVLDDSIARKIYNCLKLQGAKNVLKGPQDDQLKKDEAMARALQDEENARTSLKTGYASISFVQLQAPDRQSSVPGWSGQNPSWMTQTGRGQPAGTDTGSVHISQGSERSRPLSVADTLNQLQGGKGVRAQPHKFQHRKSVSVKSVWTGTRRRGQVDSLISIMQEEMAREEQQREQLRFLEATTDMEALATRIKRIELSHLFPSIGPDVLEDIFRSTGYSKEETVRVLYQSYSISPVPIPQDSEEILNQLRKSHARFEHIEDINDEDTPSEDSESSYEGYRNEAIFCRQLATDCQQQALRYQSKGMQGAALFYRQRAKKYKEDERLANSRAANVLFDKGSERLQLENTLDLHFYRLDEAINAVNVAIELKEDVYRKKPDKKNSYLDIVTGWGRNSKNGKAKLKPAIIHHLYAKCFQYEEKSPGMLRVYLSKKL